MLRLVSWPVELLSGKSYNFARTLPSLKKLYERKLEERCTGLNEKERRSTENSFKRAFHDHMAGIRYTDGFWTPWPRTVEEAWLSYLEVDKETQDKMKGRGPVKILNKASQKPLIRVG